MLALGKKNGWQLIGERNWLIEEASGSFSLPPLYDNFLSCIRDGSRPHADIEESHRSAALVRLGNIPRRHRRTLAFDLLAAAIYGAAVRSTTHWRCFSAGVEGRIRQPGRS
jgi:hypothetical protein